MGVLARFLYNGAGLFGLGGSAVVFLVILVRLLGRDRPAFQSADPRLRIARDLSAAIVGASLLVFARATTEMAYLIEAIRSRASF